MVHANMKRKKAMRIIQILKHRYKVSKRGEVGSSATRSPYKVLISAIISQRTKDETTARVSAKLFKHASTPKKMMELGRAGIAKTIRSANYYKGKSKRIYEISKILVKDYKGRVPKSREELMDLPGVGMKTADIVILVSYGAAVVPIDTHVQILSQRLGWSKHKRPEKIREDLHEIFPPKKRAIVNNLLVAFGKEICRKHRPKCKSCPIRKLCPYPKKNL